MLTARTLASLLLAVAFTACGVDGDPPDPSPGELHDKSGDDDEGAAIDAGFVAADAGFASAAADAGDDDPVATPADAGFVAPPPPPPPEESGACTNAADDDIHASIDVSGAVGDCAGGCFGGVSCTTNCVVEDTGLSQGCAQCYGEVTGCTSSSCALQCLGGGDSPSCSECRDASGCTAAFEECAGI